MSARGTANALTPPRPSWQHCSRDLARTRHPRPLRVPSDRHPRPDPGRQRHDARQRRQRPRPASGRSAGSAVDLCTGRVHAGCPGRDTCSSGHAGSGSRPQRRSEQLIGTTYITPAGSRVRRFSFVHIPPSSRKMWDKPIWAGGIESETVSGEAHGAICIHHWRRGFLSWQRNCGRGTRSIVAGAGLPRSSAQAGPLLER